MCAHVYTYVYILCIMYIPVALCSVPHHPDVHVHVVAAPDFETENKNACNQRVSPC